jgi:hypothetical protein
LHPAPLEADEDLLHPRYQLLLLVVAQHLLPQPQQLLRL